MQSVSLELGLVASRVYAINVIKPEFISCDYSVIFVFFSVCRQEPKLRFDASLLYAPGPVADDEGGMLANVRLL